jgi:hypothetical protein
MDNSANARNALQAISKINTKMVSVNDMLAPPIVVF